jgi:signal peptidase II
MRFDSIIIGVKKMIIPAVAAALIAVDQITKYLVRANMQPGDRIPVIGDWMSIYYVQNTGTAFSMFRGNRFITVFLTSALIIFCIVFIIIEVREGHRLVPSLFTLVAAGGISNMIDRLSLGFVTDMISCGSFAVFNIADIVVTCGCILTMIALLIMYKDEGKES